LVAYSLAELGRREVESFAKVAEHNEAEMEQVPVRCRHQIETRDGKGVVSVATLEIKYKRLRVLPPIGKKKQYPELNLTVLHAQEQEPPQERERIDWRLITDLPVGSRKDAVRML